MPLIMLSGYPCSGKSTRAAQIVSFLNSRLESIRAEPSHPQHAQLSKTKVHLLNDEQLDIQKEAYREARTEKQARGEQYSAIRRLLSKDDVVVADFMNYIKGFRYQLYCEAKSLETPSCVVHIGTPGDKCKEWDAARPEEQRWPEDILENLIFRYEEPNGMTRWDSPLFTVPYVDETPDLEGIWNALLGEGIKVRPNQATILKKAAPADVLQELERKTLEVVNAVMEYQGNGGEGGSLKVDGSDVELDLPSKKVTLAQLQRMRRQFTNLNREHMIARERVKTLFVEYLNEGLN